MSDYDPSALLSPFLILRIYLQEKDLFAKAIKITTSIPHFPILVSQDSLHAYDSSLSLRMRII